MPVSFSNVSIVGRCLPLTSMYSGQLDQITSFSLEDLSVLLQVLAVCFVPAVPHAASTPGSPRPRPPTAAADRMKDLRLRSGRTPPTGNGRGSRRELGMHGLQVRQGGCDAWILARAVVA